MSDDTLLDQAAQLESLLPLLARRLFTLDANHPAMELPVAQLRVCTLLQAGPRPMSAISEELGISVSAITQIADRLERAGLVERVTGQDDRRMKKLQLTPHGVEIMRSRREQRVRRSADALAQLPPAAREAVLAALQALVEASRATGTGPGGGGSPPPLASLRSCPRPRSGVGAAHSCDPEVPHEDLADTRLEQ